MVRSCREESGRIGTNPPFISLVCRGCAGRLSTPAAGAPSSDVVSILGAPSLQVLVQENSWSVGKQADAAGAETREVRSLVTPSH